MMVYGIPWYIPYFWTNSFFINGHERHANLFARLSDYIGEAEFELVSEILR